jgi:hypothetical protein
MAAVEMTKGDCDVSSQNENFWPAWKGLGVDQDHFVNFVERQHGSGPGGTHGSLRVHGRGARGAAEALAFLRALERELEPYSQELAAFLEAGGPTMSRSGRLALDSGVRSYTALLGWARAAIDVYETPEGGTP